MHKTQQQTLGMILIMVGLLGYFGYLDFMDLQIAVTNMFPALNNANVTQTWTENRTRFTEWSNGTTTSQNVTSLFREYWYSPTILGTLMLLLTAMDSQSYHHYHYEPISSPSTPHRESSDREDEEDEEVPEARSVQIGSVELLKCPHCGAQLKFGSSTVTNCEYCGNEVRRKEES